MTTPHTLCLDCERFGQKPLCRVQGTFSATALATAYIQNVIRDDGVSEDGGGAH